MKENDPMDQLRVFTVEEANQLIPSLTTRLVELKKLHREIVNKEAGIDAMELIAGDDSEETEVSINEEIDGLNQLILEFNRQVDIIHECGCVLKDVEIGLVDFYHLLEGQVVYLCWQLGEEKVQHWHEVGKGYTSRAALPSRETEM